MGDVVGLVEKAQAAVTESDAAKLAARMRKADFTLEDFLEQLRSVRKMGPLEDIMKMLPGMPKGAMAQMAPQKDKMKHYEAILLSMTLKERRARGVQRRPPRRAHPRDGRRRRPGREGAGRGDRVGRREARRAHAQGGLHTRGLPRAAPQRAQDGAARGHHEDAARDAQGRHGADGAAEGQDEALRGDPPEHDAQGATGSRCSAPTASPGASSGWATSSAWSRRRRPR